jgi:hypothetical protein
MNRPIKRDEFVQKYLDTFFAEDVTTKRVEPLANRAHGIMTSASLAASIAGQSLAQARGRRGEYAVRQVERPSPNQGVVVWDLFNPCGTEGVGARKAVVVAMGATGFDAADQAKRALERFPIERNRSIDQNSLQIKKARAVFDPIGSETAQMSEIEIASGKRIKSWFADRRDPRRTHQ